MEWEEHCVGLVGQLIWSRQRSSRNKEILVSTMQKAGRQECIPGKLIPNVHTLTVTHLDLIVCMHRQAHTNISKISKC